MLTSYLQITLVILIFQSTILQIKLSTLHALIQRDESCISLLPKSMCCSLVSFQVLGKHFCSDNLLCLLPDIVVENWGLGFMHRCLIAPFSVFENLTFFMIFHTNVYIFCFNRMRWQKSLWFFKYLENLSFG